MRSKESVLRQTLLERHLDGARQDLQALDRRLTPLRTEVQQLLAQLVALSIDAPAPAATSAPAPKQVAYRPPMEHPTQKHPGPLIVCENNSLTFFDMDSIKTHVRQITEVIEREAAKHGELAEVVALPDEHFDLSCGVKRIEIGQATMLSANVTLARKQGDQHLGETIEVISGSNSEFRRRLLKFDPVTTYVQFAVYPDSHDAFRASRSMVWQRGFEVRWIPLPPGHAMELGGGANTTVTQ